MKLGFVALGAARRRAERRECLVAFADGARAGKEGRREAALFRLRPRLRAARAACN